MKIRLVDSELFHADRQTDRTKLKVAFRKRETSKNEELIEKSFTEASKYDADFIYHFTIKFNIHINTDSGNKTKTHSHIHTSNIKKKLNLFYNMCCTKALIFSYVFTVVPLDGL
jgi:hypothetical protein